MVEPALATANAFGSFFFSNSALPILTCAGRGLDSMFTPIHSSPVHRPSVLRRTRNKGKERSPGTVEASFNTHWLHDSRCRLSRQPQAINISHDFRAALPLLPTLSSFSSTTTRGFPSNFVPCQVRHLSSDAAESNASQRSANFDPQSDRPNTTSYTKSSDVFHAFLKGRRMSNGGYISNVQAWDAYHHQLDQHRRSTMSRTILYRFVERILDNLTRAPFSDAADSIQKNKLWTDRALSLLETIPESLDDTSDLVAARCCLRSRIYALGGDLDASIGSYDEALRLRLGPATVGRASTDETAMLKPATPPMWELLALNTIIRILYRYENEQAVFAFLLERWESVAVHVLDPQCILTGASKKHPLRESLYAMVDAMESPAYHVTGRRNIGNVVDRLRIGEILVSILIARRTPEDAALVADILDEQDIFLPDSLRLSLVRALVRSRSRENAISIFSRVDPHQIDSSDSRAANDYLSTGLMLSSFTGDTERAKGFLRQLDARGMVDEGKISQLLHAYAVANDKDAVVDLFRSYFESEGTRRSPNIYHFTALLLVHARARDREGVQYWLRQMTQAKIAPDVHVFSILIKYYADENDTKFVSALLDQLLATSLRPSHEVFTTVISMFGRMRDSRAAEATYKRALTCGVKPDRTMNAALMNAHVEAGSWRGAIQVFDYMVGQSERRHRPQAHEFNTLFKSYIFLGAPFYVVRDLLRKMEDRGIRPTQHTYSLAIQSACDHGYMDVARSLFQRLDRLASDRTSGFDVNVYALTIILAGYLRTGNVRMARAVYEDMKERGIQPTSVTYSTILKKYASEPGQQGIVLAQNFLKQVVSMDKTVWVEKQGNIAAELELIYSPLMNYFSRQGQSGEVEKLYWEVCEAGGGPTVGLLALQLNAHRITGDVDAAREVFELAFGMLCKQTDTTSLIPVSEGSTRPTRPAHMLSALLSIYIDVLSASGLHSEAASVWSRAHDAGFAFDAHNWNHLIVVLIRAGEVSRAFSVLERVILPNRALAREEIKVRDSAPSSPLLWDSDDDEDDPSIMDDRDGASMGRQSSLRRALSVTRNRVYAPPDVSFSELNKNDFVHPLHVLQQVSPGWNQWRPHSAVVRLLWEVYQHLQDGHTVRPIPRRGELASSHDDDVWVSRRHTDPELDEETEMDDGKVEVEQDPSALVSALGRDCPVSLDYLQAWYRRDLERKAFQEQIEERTYSN